MSVLMRLARHPYQHDNCTGHNEGLQGLVQLVSIVLLCGIIMDIVQVAKLVRQMMAPDPGSRPTAREVLRSELVPPAVGDEQLTDLLRSLPDR